MKQTVLILAFFTISLSTLSQTTSVEKSSFGIQTGFLGVWAHNESRLSSRFALRSEIGLDAGIWGNNYYDSYGLLLAPVISLEPRWYYNLNKRANKSIRTDGNSGNFISIKTSYHPDWFIIASEDNINLINDISIVPTWGIRRHIGNHFTYEAGIGIGYIHYLEDFDRGILETSDVAVNLHLRIGYRF